MSETTDPSGDALVFLQRRVGWFGLVAGGLCLTFYVFRIVVEPAAIDLTEPSLLTHASAGLSLVAMWLLLRGGTRTDAGLDLARAQRPRALRAQLFELRAVAAHGGTQRFVDAHTKARPVRGHQDEMLPVLVQTHQLQLTHATSRELGTSLPPIRPVGVHPGRCGA